MKKTFTTSLLAVTAIYMSPWAAVAAGDNATKDFGVGIGAVDKDAKNSGVGIGVVAKDAKDASDAALKPTKFPHGTSDGL